MKKLFFPAIFTIACALCLFFVHTIYWIRLGDGRINVTETRIYLTPKEAKELLAGKTTTIGKDQYSISPSLQKAILSKKLFFSPSRDYYLTTELQETKMRSTFPFTEVYVDTLLSTSFAFEDKH